MLSSRVQSRLIRRAGSVPVAPTFARTGTAWDDVGNSYASGVPRFAHGLLYPGVFVEEATTNLALQSETLGDAYWSKTRTSISADATTAPNGTLTADKLVEDTTATATHYITRAGVLTASAAGTVSVYVKAAERFRFSLSTNGGTNVARFRLDTGVVVSVNGGGTASATIKDVGNGWFRCTYTQTSVLSGTVHLFFEDATGNNAYTGDGASGMYVWGFQAEALAYPTSYVPTTSATVTRNAETLTVPTAGILRPDQGGIIARAYVDSVTGSASSPSRVLFQTGTGAGKDIYLRKTGTNIQAVMTDDSNNAITNSLFVSNNPAVGYHTFGFFWGSELSICLDGVEIVSGAPATAFASSLASLLYIGANFNGTSSFWDNAIAEFHCLDKLPSKTERLTLTNGGPIPHTAYHTLLLRFTNGNLSPLGRGYSVADRLALELV